MKKLFLLGLVVALFNSCEDCPPDRFTTNSSQIDIAKQIHKYYLAGDWDAMTKHYTDSAKIRYNTWEPSTVAESQIMLQQLLAEIAEYKWIDDPIFYEQITDDEGLTWVYFWGQWEGSLKANGTVITIPVHVAWNFEGDKIANEFGFWDSSPIFQALEDAAIDGGGQEEINEAEA